MMLDRQEATLRALVAAAVDELPGYGVVVLAIPLDAPHDGELERQIALASNFKHAVLRRLLADLSARWAEAEVVAR